MVPSWGQRICYDSVPAIKTSKEFKKESDFKCGNGMLVVAVLMLLLPEPVAAADGGSEASGSPVCTALLLMFLIVVGSLQCVCWRGKARPVVVHQGTQTDEPPVSLAVAPMSVPHKCVFVATRCGEKFHSSRTCRGLNSALEVRKLERCKICG